MNSRISKSFFFFLILVISSCLLITSADAATLYFYPQNISLVPGEEALIELRINTGADVINAVEIEGVLSGVAATLRRIDNAGSAIDIFIEQPSVQGKAGFRLVGGVPAGLSGEHILAKLVVRGELSGATTLSVSSAQTKVLLADGTGKSAPLQLISSVIEVVPKAKDYLTITSISHPDQNQWYVSNKAQLNFNFDAKSQYSYVVTRDVLQDPDATPDRPEGNATWQGETKLEDLPEGVTYFALKKLGSSAVSRYRLMIDTVAPHWLEVRKSEGTVETEGRPFLNFLAEDADSGVEYYEMRIDGADPVTIISPQPLPDEYAILSIRAYDRAGNYIEEFIPGPQKEYSLWVWAAILFVLLIWVSGIIDTGKRKK